MINFVSVPKMFPRCQKVLPLVYDDSLSYYETLCKVSQKVNVLIDDVNEFMDWATQHEQDYEALVKRVEVVEGEIDNFEKEVIEMFNQLKTEQQEEFDNLVRKIDAKLAEFEREIERTLTELRNEIARVIAELRNEFGRLKDEVETELTTIRVEIAHEIEYLNNLITSNNEFIFDYVHRTLQEFIDNFPDLANIPVYNPTRGGTTGLQQALNDLYSVACVNGITCDQFDSLHITASEFDALGITASEFDQEGYNKLGYPDERYYMISPFTGQFTLVKNVVMDLAHFHMKGLTAEEYDDLALTADEFDATGITAFNFDWFGKDILTA